jgi:heat shock protein HtpX
MITKNGIRTVFLMTMVGALFMFIGGMLGGSSGMMIAFIFALGMNFFSYWYSDKMVLKMYRAVEVNPKTLPRLYSMTEELAVEAGVPMPKLYIIPQDQPNAFATGRNPENAAVAVTEGIMRLLPEDELRGVIAHEIAHIKNRDILTQTIVTTVVSAISMIAQFAIFLPIGNRDGDGPNPIVVLLSLLLAPIAAAMLQSAISRAREFEADRVGAEISHSPESLAKALQRIEAYVMRVPMEASQATQQATAHMFPVNPFRGGAMSRLFSTHPDTALRVENLMTMSRSGFYP